MKYICIMFTYHNNTMWYIYFSIWASLVAQLVKNLLIGKIPWRRERLPILVFWSGEFTGLQSMVSQRVDMTE